MSDERRLDELREARFLRESGFGEAARAPREADAEELAGFSKWGITADPDRQRRQSAIAGGLHVSTASGEAVSITWPQLMGAFSDQADRLAIVTTFCLVTLHGSNVASLSRPLLAQRLSELGEGMHMDGATVERIQIDYALPGRGGG